MQAVQVVALGVVGGHQEDVLLGDRGEGVRSGQAGVLDAAHAGEDGAAYGLVAEGVRGHREAAVGCRRDDEVHFVLGVADVGDAVAGGGETAVGGELDPVGAGPALGADRAQDGVRAVREGADDLVVALGEPGFLVPVTAVRADDVGGDQLRGPGR